MNKSNSKIVGLVVNQMSENDNNLFLIPEFRNASFIFELYDLSPLIHGISLNNNYADHSVNNLSELEDLVAGNEIFIIYFGDTLKVKEIFNIFRKNLKKNYLKINNGVIGAPKKKQSFKNKFFKLLTNPHAIMEYVYLKFSSKIEFHEFVSGTSSGGVEIPSYEYENFLKFRKISTNFEKKYHLFLDQNLCYHRNLKDLGYKLVDSPAEYFSGLNMFFDEVERKTKKKVVIALHPRADPERYDFGGRKLVFGKTDQLVSEADLVLGHFSTAIHYALLFEKDLLLLTMDSVTDFANTFIDDFSHILKIPVLNISNESNFHRYLNRSEYGSYIKKYIASDSVVIKKTTASDIIINYINALN